VIAMALETNTHLIDVRATTTAIRLLNKSRILKTPLHFLTENTLLNGTTPGTKHAQTWIKRAQSLKKSYLLTPSLFENYLSRKLIREIWFKRTLEHRNYMTARAAQRYLKYEFDQTSYIRSWFLPDDHWNRGLLYLIHIRIGKIWTKSKGCKSNLYTLTEHTKTHCILCDCPTPLDSESEIAHLIVKCSHFNRERNSSKIINDLRYFGPQEFWSNRTEEELAALLCGATISTIALWKWRGVSGINFIPYEIRMIKFLRKILWVYHDALQRITSTDLINPNLSQ
jgi:hypothetical protein